MNDQQAAPLPVDEDLVAIAETAFEEGRVEDAAAAYEAALEQDPGSIPARIGRGKVLLATGRVEEAVEIFEGAVRADGAHPGALLGLGLAHHAAGRSSTAIGWIKLAWTEGAPDLLVVRQLLEAAKSMRDFGAIEPVLAACSERHAEETHYAFAHAGVLQRLGRSADAAKVCEGLLRVDPGNADAAALLEIARAASTSTGEAPSPGAAFRRDLLRDVLNDTQHEHADNWDKYRNEHATDFERGQPLTGFNAERAGRELAWAIDHADVLAETAAAMSDERSRTLLRALVRYRVLGHRHVKLPTHTTAYAAAYTGSLAFVTEWGTSAYVEGYPRLAQDNCHRFRLPFDGATIDVESIVPNVAFTFLHRQYYLHRPGVSVRPTDGDVVIDAGACWAETALAFAASAGPNGRVHSFECDPANLERFRANLARNPELASRIRVSATALAAQPGGTVSIRPMGIATHVVEGPGTIQVPTESIDRYVAAQGLPRVDFIKMDIEGAEIPALLGAAETIRRFRPKLAICVYHWPDDLWKIPRLVRELEPSYRLWLDHYSIDTGETVLYAAADGRESGR